MFIVAVLIVLIWVVVEVKRMKHKVFAIVLIALILLTYFSFSSVFRGKDVDLRSIPGIVEAGKIYLSWLGGIFSNFRTLTGNVVDMNWKSNITNVTT